MKGNKLALAEEMVEAAKHCLRCLGTLCSGFCVTPSSWYRVLLQCMVVKHAVEDRICPRKLTPGHTGRRSNDEVMGLIAQHCQARQSLGPALLCEMVQ